MMRTLLLAAVAAFAAPVKAQQFNCTINSHFEVVTWNGQVALLLWDTRRSVVQFQRSPGLQALALDVHLAMAVDDRPCAIGNRPGAENGDGAGHEITFGVIPPSGIAFATPNRAMWDSYPFMAMGTYYTVSYCYDDYNCGGCTNHTWDIPQLWAVICTVRLL